MRRDNWEVKEFGIRPAGSPNHCFYCHEPRGGVHKPDCVIRQRTVVVRMLVEYTIAIPEHWTAEDFERHRNEGRWCSLNGLAELERISEHHCLCGSSIHEFVREASEKDEERDQRFVANEKS